MVILETVVLCQVKVVEASLEEVADAVVAGKFTAVVVAAVPMAAEVAGVEAEAAVTAAVVAAGAANIENPEPQDCLNGSERPNRNSVVGAG